MFEDAIIDWDDDDDPDGNVVHIERHGVDKEDFEYILTSPDSVHDRTRRTRRPASFGSLPDGRHLTIVYEFESDDPLVIRPVTAFWQEED